METELKLSFSAVEDIDRLWSDTVFASYKLPDSGKEIDFETTYYDTTDFILRRKMASLRIRKILDADFIHTVKIRVEEKDGLHQRYEWNLETDSETFDIDFFIDHAISDGDPHDLLKEILADIRDRDLNQLFVTTFHRKSFMVGYGDSLIEVANDNGNISIDSRAENFCEIELELKEGSVRDVIALGDEILAHTNASLYNHSKYQRGMSLLKEIQTEDEL